MIDRLLCAALVLATLQPAIAQTQPTVKELLDRAQSETDKRAVEELIKKLKSQATPARPNSTASAPAVVTQPNPAPRAPSVESWSVAPGAVLPSDRAGPAVVAAPHRSPPPIATVPLSPTESPAGKIASAPEIAERLNLPRVDIEVFFDMGSAAITPQAAEQLITLGKALADPRLEGSKFVIGGHTDAFGPASYNLALSQLRAEAVRKFIVDNFKVPPDALIAKGYGFQIVKVPGNPFAPQNRRVQIINWTSPSLTGEAK